MKQKLIHYAILTVMLWLIVYAVRVTFLLENIDTSTPVSPIAEGELCKELGGDFTLQFASLMLSKNLVVHMECVRTTRDTVDGIPTETKELLFFYRLLLEPTNK